MVLAYTAEVRAICRRLEELEDDMPADVWRRRVDIYIELVKNQGDRPNTRRTLRAYLSPWVEWLIKKGGRPTAQKIKAHLVERKLSHTSYKKVG